MSETRNAFTIDVEDWFQVAALAAAVPRESWPEQQYRVEANTERLLQVASDAGIRGTFFVLGWVANRSPGLVRRIASLGHEVASHGWSHELVYLQSRKTFREETLRSKRLLEDLAAAPVIGYRAASFSVTAASLWALDELLEAGFLYDSSVFPIRHDRYGIPGACPEPHLLRAPSGRLIAEFPMSTARWLGQRVPVSGGGYFRLLPYAVISAGLRQINVEQGQPFTFYLHPWEVDPGQPRLRVSALSRLRHYTNLKRTEPRLRRMLTEFRFATMAEVLAERGLLDPAQRPCPPAAKLNAPA